VCGQKSRFYLKVDVKKQPIVTRRKGFVISPLLSRGVGWANLSEKENRRILMGESLRKGRKRKVTSRERYFIVGYLMDGRRERPLWEKGWDGRDGLG